jgi:hypothetical protein
MVRGLCLAVDLAEQAGAKRAVLRHTARAEEIAHDLRYADKAAGMGRLMDEIRDRLDGRKSRV